MAPGLRARAFVEREGTSARRAPSSTILRFRASERVIHWAIAVPFMICFASAVVLVFVYNPAPTRPYRQLVSLVHRVSGLCLIVFPLLALLAYRRDYRIHLYNIRQGWVWTVNDLKWLCLMGLAALSSRFKLPEQGKFNAAEKMNFMMVMTFSPLFILTGILIWLPGVDIIAWFAHMGLAALAAPLMLGHIFMATVNPGTRVGLSGMISGRVDREWAKHHYRSWYRELFEPGAERGPSSPIEAPPLEGTFLAHCRSCREPYAVASLDELVERVFSQEAVACPHCGVGSVEIAVVADPRRLAELLGQLQLGPTASLRAGG